MVSYDINKIMEEIKRDEHYLRVISKSINELDLLEGQGIYERLLDLTKENNLMRAYSWTLHNNGWIYHDLGEFDKAIKIHEEAYDVFKANNDVEGITYTLNALSANFSIQQMYDKAIEYGILGIEIGEKVGDYFIVNVIKGNIALVYMETGEFDKAKELINQVRRLPHIGDKSNEIVTLVNLAYCEHETDNYNEALSHLKDAEELALKYDTKLYPHILDQMARVYTKEKKYSIAKEYFKKSVDLSIEGDLKLYLYEALIYWSILDIEEGKPKEAIEKLLKILEYKGDITSPKLIKVIYKNLNIAYRDLRDFEKAYYYLYQYNELEIKALIRAKDESIRILDRKTAEEEEKVYKLLYDQTEAIYKLGQRITANLNNEEMYNIIAEEIKNLIKYDIVNIGIVKDDLIEYELSLELNEKVQVNSIYLNEDCLSTFAIKNNQEILINDFDKEGYKYVNDVEKYLQASDIWQESSIDLQAQSMIFVPIVVGEKVIGVISIQKYEKNSYSLKDVTTIRILSTYIAIALENTRLYNEIQYNANYDALTKMLNRRAVLKELEKSYENVKKYGFNNYVVMLDIDNFKKINDTYGHSIGDEVLKFVSNIIKRTIGENDVVGRYGGEEFIIMINENNEFLQVAENIRKNVESFKLEVEESLIVSVTISIGITKIVPNKFNLNKCISIADKALYAAKNTGKNKVVVIQ